MKRYKDISQDDIFSAWNKLRDALLAAKDGHEVEEIMKSLFTDEEKFQLGRRIMIAECIKDSMTNAEICDLLKVGRSTVTHILRRVEKYPKGFMLIEKRGKRVKREYENKKYKEVGGSRLIWKKKIYTGVTKKDIKR
ncbi:MAG TPA: Trp family transcriptional regulator [Candidatus Levybacteria bacterium]|nr:Trp family transcriptional regulator [Candidatus Levybacteria bacterium]